MVEMDRGEMTSNSYTMLAKESLPAHKIGISCQITPAGEILRQDRMWATVRDSDSNH